MFFNTTAYSTIFIKRLGFGALPLRAIDARAFLTYYYYYSLCMTMHKMRRQAMLDSTFPFWAINVRGAVER